MTQGVSWVHFDLHPLDPAVLAVYFLIVTFLGVVVGKKQTKNLSDFFIAGGKWGPTRDIFALIIPSTFGAVVQPILFSLIVVGKNERAATQCGWGHLWKRTVTILFAVYGLLFFLYNPNLAVPEQAWGIVITVFAPAIVSLVSIYFVSKMTRPESEVLLKRFYCILNTPLGEDDSLKAVGIRLPMMKTIQQRFRRKRTAPRGGHPRCRRGQSRALRPADHSFMNQGLVPSLRLGF